MTATLPLLTRIVSVRRRPALLLCAVGLLTAGRASAQTQETRMDQILHADRNQTSSYADRTFASSASIGGKQAETRSFAFSKSAVLRGGDGSFQTRSFSDKGQFRTDGFATKADRLSNRDAFTQGDRGFATKAMPVNEAAAAGKSAPGVRPYLPADKNIVIRGKRQDTIDDIHNQKDLSIDQVREILNKPGGRPAPNPFGSSTPVLRALPVNALTAQ